YYWDFGDGTTGTGASTGHSYGQDSTWTVSVLVINPCGDSSGYSQIIKTCLMPIASWTYNVLNTSSQGMEVHFDGSASQNAHNYTWDFGDGNSISGGVSVIHTYTTPSLFYKVTLEVTNDCGEKSTLS